MEVYDDLIMEVSFEMNLDQNVVKRINYSVLDLFADVGGMMRALTVFIEFGVIVLSLNKVDDFLVT